MSMSASFQEPAEFRGGAKSAGLYHANPVAAFFQFSADPVVALLSSTGC
jgi:hypothetical protein